MRNKTRLIPGVIVGAILLSLLAIVPAFGVDEVGFIDPGDINDDGTLSDSTPDDQEWARQGGRIGLMLSADELDTPVKRVLIPSIDATMVGTGDVNAHMATISNVRASGLSADDHVLIGMNTVRKVESVTTTDGDTTINVDKAFAMGMSSATIYRINNSVTNLSPWDDNYSSYAMAEVIGSGQATYRASGSVSRYDAQHAIVDSDVGRNTGSSPTPLDRLTGSGTGIINTADVLVVKVSGSTSEAIPVAYVSGDRIEMKDIPGASAANPLGLGANESAYLVYWAEERNETGSVVTVRSQAHQDPVTAVLTETTPTSGKFVLEILTIVPQDANGDDVMPDFSASVPTLPVNPRDVVTLAGDDSTGTLTVETTNPVFSGFAPAHNTSGRDERPEVSAQVTDGDSGLDEDGDNIYVIFRITEGASTRTVTKSPKSDGEVIEVAGGFEVRQRISGSDAPSGDATIEWWVKAMDEAGNVGYSDRLLSVDGEGNPCTADENTAVTGLEGAGCQPYKIIVDGTKPSLLRAETGRHWDNSLDTGDSDDETEYRVARADPTSVLVVFNEHLDDATVTAADFEVDGASPIDAKVHNVKVRDDSEDGDGNDSIMGDDVQNVGEARGYVFLTVEEMGPSAQPTVELVGEVSDLAGNRKGTGKDNEADDRIAPTLTVLVAEGDRPVTRDMINLTITSNENISAPSVTYYMVMSVDGEQTLGAERRATPVFKSATEYTATIDPAEDGLYTVHVAAHDNSGGNRGSKGDNSAPVDVYGSTSAILFERDTNLSAPDVDPDMDGVQDELITSDPDTLISIDFSSEGSEYDASENGDDLDTHGMVTIVSAMLGDEDITDSLQPNQDGNVYLYRTSGLKVGGNRLSVIAIDEAGNRNSSAFEATITITVVAPDLTVDTPTLSSSGLTPGATFTLDTIVRNRGGSSSGPTTLRFYRSTDSTITSTDTPVGTRAVGGLRPSASRYESITLTAPSTHGTYHYGACVDAVSGEYSTANNCSSTAILTVSALSSVPGTPTGLTAAANGETQIDLSWRAPSADGGSAITGYRIEVSPDSSSWSIHEADSGSTLTRYSHTGLTAGSTRHYRVSAINSAGAGQASSVAGATTDSPGTPAVQAVRSFSSAAVALGGQLVVTIEAGNYGSFGGVVETLPTGFVYVSSSLPTDSVATSGQMARFTLFGESSFTYTVTASNTVGQYSFSGILRDSTGLDHPVGGASGITVGDAPGVNLTVSGSPRVRLRTSIPVTATFSEQVSGFALNDITVANGLAANFIGSDGDSAYTFDVTPSSVGPVTVDIAGDVATDAGGNGNLAAFQLLLGIPYDDDGDSAISRDEVITAINDYLFSGTITRDQVVALINLYLFG